MSCPSFRYPYGLCFLENNFLIFMSRKATKDFIDNTSYSSCCYFYDCSPSIKFFTFEKILKMEKIFGFLFLNILQIFCIKNFTFGAQFCCVSITHLVRMIFHFTIFFSIISCLTIIWHLPLITRFFPFYIFSSFFIINNRNKSCTIFLFS